MARLELDLFGPLRVMLDGRPVEGFESARARALLVYLAAEAGRPHRREALAGLLWPELAERAARHNLSQALFNLRAAIADQAADPPFLLVSRDAIQLNPAADHRVDISEFRRLLAAAEAHPHQQLDTCPACAQRLGAAAALYAGDFLAQLSLAGSAAFEEWAAVRREQLRAQALAALEALASYHERRGAYGRARELAARQLALEPLAEAAHRRLMRVLTLDGERALALAQYERCRALLAAELGVEPEEETRALHAQLRAGEVERPEAERRLAPPSRRPHNLPAQPTPFVGRERELAAIAALLARPDCRLVTLVGTGGAGKTRLALQAAAEQLEAFADGVWCVALAEVRAPELIAPAIRDALRPSAPGAEDARGQLLAHLAPRRLLLVVDNCEHLLAGAGLLAELLAAAPGLAILATSRERLGLRGEWLLEVGGLCDHGEEGLGAESPAVALFAQSARRLRAGFALAAEDLPHVAAICRLVDGLPLGLELAAGWARTLAPAEIAAEIRRSLAFLTTSLRDVPERHRSLLAVVGHSWALLAPEERRAARRCAVFHGGCRREAAERVAGASVGALAALVDKSLLRRSVAGRYTMHEAVAHYAREQLELAGEGDELRARHLAAFVELAEAAEPRLLGAEQGAWLDRLEAEHDNLRAALRWALDRGEAGAAARLGAALWRFWWVRSHADEGRRWLEAALAAGGAPPELRARLLHGAGVLTQEQGDYERARALYAESLALRRELGDRQGVASSLNSLGVVALDQGDHAGAAALFGESLALKRELADRRGIAGSLNNLGMVASASGDHAGARRLYEESLALQRELGSGFAIATVLGNLGAVALEQGDPAAARAHFAESLRLFRELGDKDGIAECLEGLAGVAVGGPGEPRLEVAGLAALLCGAAEALREAIGAPPIPMERARIAAIAARARARLGDGAFAELRARGRGLPLDEAAAAALGA